LLEDQLDLITKGAAEIVPLEALKERVTKSIATGKPMRIKAGFDPTACARWCVRVCVFGRAWVN
jgi:tyrosyl-tRNA synthetase